MCACITTERVTTERVTTERVRHYRTCTSQLNVSVTTERVVCFLSACRLPLAACACRLPLAACRFTKIECVHDWTQLGGMSKHTVEFTEYGVSDIRGWPEQEPSTRYPTTLYQLTAPAYCDRPCVNVVTDARGIAANMNPTNRTYTAIVRVLTAWPQREVVVQCSRMITYSRLVQWLTRDGLLISNERSVRDSAILIGIDDGVIHARIVVPDDAPAEYRPWQIPRECVGRTAPPNTAVLPNELHFVDSAYTSSNTIVGQFNVRCELALRDDRKTVRVMTGDIDRIFRLRPGGDVWRLLATMFGDEKFPVVGKPADYSLITVWRNADGKWQVRVYHY